MKNSTTKSDLEKAAKKWISTLTEEEKFSLKSYSKNLYRDINKYLANNETEEIDAESLQLFIDEIKSSLSKFHYNKSFIAYRGVSQEEFEEILQNDTIIEFLDFKSSSISYEEAECFSFKSMMKNDGYYRYIVQYTIRQNATGAYLNNREVTEYPSEQEFLLDCGQKYKVIGKPITDANEKLTVIKVEVLGHE